MVERSLGVREVPGSIPGSPTRDVLPAAAVISKISSYTGYSSIGRALGSGPRGSQFKPEYPEILNTVPNSLTRRRFVVSGRVQGVGFRWFVHDCAESLGLRGWVRNRSDGAVEAEAEGRPQDLTELLRRLRAGPGGAAQVDKVEATTLPTKGGEPHFYIL